MTPARVDRLLADRDADVRYAVVFVDRLTVEQSMRIAEFERSKYVLDMLVHGWYITDDVLRWVAANRTDDEAAAVAKDEVSERLARRAAGVLDGPAPVCLMCGATMAASGPETTPHWRCPVCGFGAIAELESNE